jgi:hypothetical protein
MFEEMKVSYSLCKQNMMSLGEQASWAKMTSPGGKVTALACHLTNKVSKAEELTCLSTNIGFFCSNISDQVSISPTFNEQLLREKSLCQKITSRNCKHIKALQKTLIQKVARKILVKLTPGRKKKVL